MLITHVSADGAEWIHTAVRNKAPQAVICLDAFHVVGWTTKALDEVRRSPGAELRRAGATEMAAGLKGTPWALLKNPNDLTTMQRTTVASLSKTNSPIYRAYRLKEQIRRSSSARVTTVRRCSPAGSPGRRIRSWPRS